MYRPNALLSFQSDRWRLYLYTRWVDLCVVLVSTLLFWPVWRRGKKKKKRTARERERERGERDCEWLERETKTNTKEPFFDYSKCTSSPRGKTQKKSKTWKWGPRGVAGLIYVENMTQKNHDPDNILIQRQQEKLFFFLLWVFKNFFELHLTFSKLLLALFI